MNFCRRCGAPLHNTKDHLYTCKNGHGIFANASPASFIWIVNDENEVLVIIRGAEPGLGRLDAPGGFNDGAETFEVGLAREIEEEVGLVPSDYTKPIYLLSGIDTYHYKDEIIDVLSGAFWARMIGNPVVTPQDDAAEAYFVPISAINPDDIYFPSAKKALIQLKEQLLSR